MGILTFDIFKRDVRVRVSGIVIRDEKLLLIAHKKKGIIYWLLPGGGVNYGESLEDALFREFKEELNIEISVGKPVIICDSINPDGGRHVLNISFMCSYNKGDFILGKERRLHDYGFFDRDQLPGVTMHPPINESLVALLEGKIIDLYLGTKWLNQVK